MLRRTTFAAMLTAAFALGATTADAHPRLRSATPASGATLKLAPKEIRMKFSEGLIEQFTGVEMKDASGRSVPIGKAMLNPKDNTKLVVSIQTRLVAGTYSVTWHAVSVDTHRIAGNYTFNVAR